MIRYVLFERDDWGAKVPIERTPFDPGPERRVVIHHSGDDHLELGDDLEAEAIRVRAIERFHTDPRPAGRAWSGIAYGFLIAPSGHVFVGRGWERAGAHAGSRAINFDSISICFLQDGRVTPLTPAAIASCRNLISDGIHQGHLTDDCEINGHRDFKATECPGDLIYSNLEMLDPRVGRG